MACTRLGGELIVDHGQRSRSGAHHAVGAESLAGGGVVDRAFGEYLGEGVEPAVGLGAASGDCLAQKSGVF